MFDFLSKVEGEFSNRIREIEKMMAVYSGSAIVAMQSFLELFAKTIEKNSEHSFNFLSNDNLGKRISNPYFALFLEKQGINANEVVMMKEINGKANEYKHQKTQEYNTEDIKKYYILLFNISKKLYKSIFKKEIKDEFNEEYYSKIFNNNSIADNDDIVKSLENKMEDLKREQKFYQKELESKLEDANVFSESLKQILEEKNKEIEELTKELQEKGKAKNVQETYDEYRAQRVICSASFVKDDNSFSLYNVHEYVSSTSKYRPFYAVVNNMLQKGCKVNLIIEEQLTVKQCKEIIRLELLILHLIRNDKLNDEKWDINYISGNRKELLLAIMDIHYRIKLLLKLANQIFISPIINIKTDSEKINGYVNIKYSKDVVYDNEIYSICDEYSNLKEYSLWFDDKIKYKVKNENVGLLRELMVNLFDKYTDFRQGQFPIIKNVLNNNDTIGILPTGGGKSLVYQLVTLLQPKASLIVSPTVSLIQNQYEKLVEYGINTALCINSSQNLLEKKEGLEKLKDFKCNYIFISPERLQNKDFRKILFEYGSESNIKAKLGMIVFDEVHCVSEWGHNFRTAYLMVTKTINSICKNIQCIGLSATVSLNVIKDLEQELRISRNNIIRDKKLKRDNIEFEIKELESNSQIEEQIREECIKTLRDDDEANKSIILFTVRKKTIEQFYPKINTNELKGKIGVYHSTSGNLTEQEKTEQMRRFMQNETKVMLANEAFGIGIDKENIAKVIHIEVPATKESFYQQVGRVARGVEEKGKSILYYKKPSKNNQVRIDEFMASKIDIKKLKYIAENRDMYEESLSAGIYFLGESLVDSHEEAQAASKVFNSLVINKFIHFNDITKIDKEKYLYILHKIGIVDNWTVDYVSHQIEVTLTKTYKDINSIKSAAIKYLELYSYSEIKDSIYNISNIKCIDELEKLIYIVRCWYYDTFVKSRKEQLRNMYYFIQKYKNKADSIGINNELEASFDISGFLSEKSVYKITEAISISEMINIVNEIDVADVDEKIIDIGHILESGENNKLLLARCLIYLLKGEIQNIEELNSILKTIDIEELKEFYKNIGLIYDRLENEIKKHLLEMMLNVNKLLFNEILLKNIKYDDLITNFAIKNINNKLEDIFGKEQ